MIQEFLHDHRARKESPAFRPKEPLQGVFTKPFSLGNRFSPRIPDRHLVLISDWDISFYGQKNIPMNLFFRPPMPLLRFTKKFRGIPPNKLKLLFIFPPATP
ncbi:MAG: hypothetical protein AMJ94_18310 [Deltaproteobacteria bacterium SM23_61]|nr:MAG: hypothetical protein AMJ94_18310 [Deltaproteobacteria bacterium SM23_61]